MSKLQHLLNKVNKVTSCYRHGREISNCAMDALCNAQIEFEQGGDVYKETIARLLRELEYQAEVINKRDGTIKQLQKRVRTLEKISVDSDLKIHIDR